MKYHFANDRVVPLVQAIADTCRTLMHQVGELKQHLGLETTCLNSPLQNLFGENAIDAATMFNQPIIDIAARTVTFRGRTCSLGNTLVFRMLERLSRRPNDFISFERLRSEVWDGYPKSDEAIRSVVNELRERLRRAGMGNLAATIRGQKRAYALVLNDLPIRRAKSNGNPTSFPR